MTVLEIVQAWLKEHEYDGLYNAGGECACLLDQLAPDCEVIGDCCAGYKVACVDCDHVAAHDWHIVPEATSSVTTAKIQAGAVTTTKPKAEDC